MCYLNISLNDNNRRFLNCVWIVETTIWAGSCIVYRIRLFLFGCMHLQFLLGIFIHYATGTSVAHSQCKPVYIANIMIFKSNVAANVVTQRDTFDDFTI